MTFRRVIFWVHLVAGIVAGVSIAIMCFTGTVLAFEQEIVGWAERDARRVVPPADLSARLPLESLQRKLREVQPEFHPAGVTLQNDPAAAVAFSAGRDGGFYVNPYSGEVRQPASAKVRDFMHVMTDWHRYLALAGDHRPLGKLINGTCNLAFCVLALTGLYLWWPRTWSRRGLQAIALINLRSTGKARDFNWHNAIGLWSAPVLIVLTLTAVPISFRWGGNLIYRLTGEEAPAQPGPGTVSTGPAVGIKRPTPDTRPLGYDFIVAQVRQEFPRWAQISLRIGGPQRTPRPAAAAPAENTPAAPRASAANSAAPRGDRDPGDDRATVQPLTITIREAASWPRTATTTLTLNPFTGETLGRSGYADLSAARRIRSWTRFLHTGQALGWGGQLVAGLASLGGCFLVYTGFALSWRRFFSRPAKSPPNGTMPL